MTKLIALSCLAMVLSLDASALAQATTTVTATADAYTRSGSYANTNFGAETTLLVRRATPSEGFDRNAYLRFALPQLTGNITSARLRLYGRHDQGGSGVAIRVLPITGSSDFSETQLTYNNAATQAPANFAAPTSGTPVTNVAAAAPAWYEWDVTQYVVGQLESGRVRLAVHAPSTNLYRATFNAREAASNRPTLVITTDAPPPPASPSNWPMFGHDHNNSRSSNDTTISAANVARLGVVRRVTGSGVTSTPAVVDGVVYYADFGGNLKGVNASTGASVWTRRLQSTMLSPSPFVSSDSVYVAGDNSTVYSVNRSNGSVRWSRRIETTQYSRISSSPVVVDNTLIIGTGSYQVWYTASPAFRGRIVGLDATTGTIKWSIPVCTGGCTGVSVWSTAAADPTSKLAFIGTGQAYTAPAGPLSDSLVAFNYETGSIAWSYQFTANDVYTSNSGGLDHDVGAAPNLFEVNGRKLVGVGDKSGRYLTFDRTTGALLWNTRVTNGSNIGGIMHSPAYANGVLYVVSNTAKTGTRGTQYPTGGSAFALDAATGAILWSKTLPGGGFGGVCVANGLMYFMTWDGVLRVLNATDGTLLRSVAAGTTTGSYVPAPTDGFPNGSASGPVVRDGAVYVGYGWTWGGTIAGGLAVFGLQ
jgi:polyvinyl alcohol dehydrogenase (cytochrome)